MRTATAITIAITLATAILAAVSFTKGQLIMAQQTSVSSPIRCLLSDPDLQKRRNEVVETLGQSVQIVEELPDGYRLQFAADQGASLIEFVQFERGCCPFMRYTLTFEPEDGPLWFSLSGPEGTKAFLKPLLDTLSPKTQR